MIIEQHQISDFSMSDKQNMVLCFGCFDLIHIGHIRMLESLKKVTSTLVVCVANDQTVKKLKGRNRPIISANERVIMLNALKCVDYAFIQETGSILELKKKYNFSDSEMILWENLFYLLSILKPKFTSFSTDRELTKEFKKYCNDENIQIIEMPYYQEQSTSKIIAKIFNDNQ